MFDWDHIAILIGKAENLAELYARDGDSGKARAIRNKLSKLTSGYTKREDFEPEDSPLWHELQEEVSCLVRRDTAGTFDRDLVVM